MSKIKMLRDLLGEDILKQVHVEDETNLTCSFGQLGIYVSRYLDLACTIRLDSDSMVCFRHDYSGDPAAKNFSLADPNIVEDLRKLVQERIDFVKANTNVHGTVEEKFDKDFDDLMP